MIKKYSLLLFVLLLASCGQMEQKKEKKQVEETVIRMEETLQVTIIQKGKVEKILKQEEAKIVVDIMNKAEKQEITGSFGEPEYEIQVEKNGKKETYRAWLRGESREGWLQNQKGTYMLTKSDTEKLLSILPIGEKQKNDDTKGNVLTEVTKKDMQITAFHIKTDEKKINYTIFYTISDSLYKTLEIEGEYYFQLIFPEKVQQVVEKGMSGPIAGEKVREGYKKYEVHLTVPIESASTSQLKALETYYDHYNLQVLNHNKAKVGTFQNIIQIVKDYGEKMNLQR
ncbi:hypothetical protein CON65_08150 [Bacillus pseudomycoides]|uniref:YhfM-like domain-containing protein n=2 Tax=Bacillaceae TaxID=186817 RepID=A0AA91VDT4_9BACI|nr:MULTISPECIES: hypothetical protein [Bacillus]PEB52689.1 hypothetical protein COO03_11430 [Bacillus sp. AFS098217]PED83151.1 hypothetical protein CON65_08150 [Bacillus pseudomycoides]PEU14004.1 hypothetical protein CN524_10560 [Bacillus sp. AFS019443]PEU18777.1 hypothetical protein CN525_09405 [Bacillus sp. AFS014408]PFW63761.1 hypothetical protein COL20_08140 [Bacillus sp. AFS075034]